MANFNKKSRNSMKWVVVKFIDAKDFSVIPINWLVETDTENMSMCSVKYCKWPPIRVTSDDLQYAEDPDESWSLYKIKILGGNKTYGQFAKAWHKQVLESTDDEEIFYKKQKCQASVSSDDSYIEDIGYNIAPAVAKSVPISCEPSDELLERSYINLQSSTSRKIDDNLNIAIPKENFIRTTSISDVQDSNKEESFNSQKFISASSCLPFQNFNFEQNQNFKF